MYVYNGCCFLKMSFKLQATAKADIIHDRRWGTGPAAGQHWMPCSIQFRTNNRNYLYVSTLNGAFPYLKKLYTEFGLFTRRVAYINIYILRYINFAEFVVTAMHEYLGNCHLYCTIVVFLWGSNFCGILKIFNFYISCEWMTWKFKLMN